MTPREIAAEEEVDRLLRADEKTMRLYWQAVRAWAMLGLALFLARWRLDEAKRRARVTRRLFYRRKDRVRRTYLRSVGVIS